MIHLSPNANLNEPSKRFLRLVGNYAVWNGESSAELSQLLSQLVRTIESNEWQQVLNDSVMERAVTKVTEFPHLEIKLGQALQDHLIRHKKYDRTFVQHHKQFLRGFRDVASIISPDRIYENIDQSVQELQIRWEHLGQFSQAAQLEKRGIRVDLQAQSEARNPADYVGNQRTRQVSVGTIEFIKNLCGSYLPMFVVTGGAPIAILARLNYQLLGMLRVAVIFGSETAQEFLNILNRDERFRNKAKKVYSCSNHFETLSMFVRGEVDMIVLPWPNFAFIPEDIDYVVVDRLPGSVTYGLNREHFDQNMALGIAAYKELERALESQRRYAPLTAAYAIVRSFHSFKTIQDKIKKVC